MSESRNQLKRLCPESRLYSDAELDLLLADAASLLNSKAFGDRYQIAAVYRAAHHLVMAKRGEEGLAGAGPLSSQGITTVGYGTSEMSDLMSTPYGRMYLGIVRGSVIPMRVSSE